MFLKVDAKEVCPWETVELLSGNGGKGTVATTLLTQTFFWKSAELRENGIRPPKLCCIRKNYSQVNLLLVRRSVTYSSAMGSVPKGVHGENCQGDGPA